MFITLSIAGAFDCRIFIGIADGVADVEAFDDAEDVVDEFNCSLSFVLFGFGGNAGRDFSSSLDDAVARLFVCGATIEIRDVVTVFEAVDVTFVGATLLIGFRGGTTNPPDEFRGRDLPPIKRI